MVIASVLVATPVLSAITESIYNISTIRYTDSHLIVLGLASRGAMVTTKPFERCTASRKLK